MTRTDRLRLNLMPMTLVASLLVLPVLVVAQTTAPAMPGAPLASTPPSAMPATPAAPLASTLPAVTPATPGIRDGAPGNPPGTLLGRTVDRATGTSTVADGMPGNPPGTALGRAATATTAAITTAFASPPGTAAYERPRMSQIIGARVYNDRNESIGEVDDLLLNTAIGTAHPGPVAVIQVGGFLGIGGRLVLVPLNDLRWNAGSERMTLSGATKETLEARPAFEYSTLHRG
jgi:sporulation protein YlmC with PRC-barrel domain